MMQITNNKDNNRILN